MSTSITFYPSLDGVVSHYLALGSGISWADLIVAAGNVFNYTTSQTSIAYLISDNQTGKWKDLVRAIYLFDTSALPDNAIILSAVFSVYGYQKVDTGGWTPSTNVYLSEPASESALVAGDFDSLGSTPFCDTPIAYGDWDTSGYNDFTLNATGIAAISKTGITKLGIRNANYDVAGVAPTWASFKGSGVSGTFNEQGTIYRPKLVVTYEIAGAGLKVKGEQISYGAYSTNYEQLITGTATGETPTGWNLKVKGTYLYWIDDDGNERRKEGTATGSTGTAGIIKVKGERVYYIDDDGDERYLSVAIWSIGTLNNGYPYLTDVAPSS